MFFEPLQGWGLHRCPGQPGPTPDHSFRKENFPNIQSEPPLVQLEAIASRPITGYLGEETNTYLTTPSCQVAVESDQVSPQPLEHPVPTPCHGQGPLPPAQGAPSSIQPGFEPCQGRGSHSSSGQPGSGFHHPNASPPWSPCLSKRWSVLAAGQAWLQTFGDVSAPQ